MADFASAMKNQGLMTPMAEESGKPQACQLPNGEALQPGASAVLGDMTYRCSWKGQLESWKTDQRSNVGEKIKAAAGVGQSTAQGTRRREAWIKGQL